MRVLIVEDNGELREMVGGHLRSRGFAVDAVGRVDEASAALSLSSPDIMILDLGLPDGDGSSLLREARVRSQGRLPVLILTARDAIEDRLRLLNAGADDFVIKPFDLLELEARIRAVLRRPGVREELNLRCGDLILDLGSKEAFCGSKRLDLGRREVALLEELMRSCNRTVARDTLEDRLYAFNEAVTPNALEQSVSRLRRKILGASSTTAIETKRGIGYRLHSDASNGGTA